MARSSARESIGSSIGAYTITRAIGAGGMGVVYLGAATDPRGGRFDVAIKELGPHLFGDPTERARFLRETRVSGLIRHPNVVRTLDVVEANGSVYHVMEFVDGMSLHELLGAARAQGRPLPADVVVRIVVDVLAGLAGAYRSQSENGEPLKVVHRDVSPQNILIGNDGRVLLADFGIAKTATHHTKDADHGFRGKVRYVAPEQIKNEPVAHGTDIYSACVCAWEAFAGRPLFEGDTLAITVARVLAGNIPSLRDFNPQIPEALDGLIRRGLSAELSSRPLDAEAFSRALASTLAPASRESLADVVRAFRRAPRIADASGPPGATVTVSVVRTVGSISEGGLVAAPSPDTFAPEPEPRAFRIDIGQEEHELLSAVSRHQLARPAAQPLQRLRDQAQAGVSAGMAMAVVEGLEVVDVGEGESEHLGEAHGAAPFLPRGLVEPAAIGDAGQGVLGGHAFEKVASRLEFEVRAHTGAHDGGVDRLHDVVDGARLEALGLILGLLQAGHEDDRDPLRGFVGLETAAHLEPVHAGHPDIQEHQVGRGREFEGLACARRREHLVISPERFGEGANIRGPVVHDQNAGGLQVHGSPGVSGWRFEQVSAREGSGPGKKDPGAGATTISIWGIGGSATIGPF